MEKRNKKFSTSSKLAILLSYLTLLLIGHVVVMHYWNYDLTRNEVFSLVSASIGWFIGHTTNGRVRTKDTLSESEDDLDLS
jgi:hypothetical protein